MGGENSEIMDTTTDIALESAYFDPVGIRRTSKGLGLSTEASYRFERGIDPAMQADAATRAAFLMQELAGARVLKGVIDVNHLDPKPRRITLRKNYLEKVLGIGTIDEKDVRAILTGLGLGVIEGLTKVFYPEASNTVIFVIMVIVLLIKPAGLFGKER